MGQIPSARGLNFILVGDGRKCHRLLILFAFVRTVSSCDAWTLEFHWLVAHFDKDVPRGPTFVCSIPGLWCLNFQCLHPKNIRLDPFGFENSWHMTKKTNGFNPFFPNSIGDRVEGPYFQTHPYPLMAEIPVVDACCLKYLTILSLWHFCVLSGEITSYFFRIIRQIV